MTSASVGKEGFISGGVFDQGTHEENGPVTWEALASPRHIPVWRRAGDPSPTHNTWRVHVLSAYEAQKKRPQRGRPPARGTRAVADGRQGVGGLHTSEDVGEQDHPGPGRAKAARVGVSFRRDPCPTP